MTLLGSAEVAEYVGITRSGLAQRRYRGAFPDPMVELRCGPIWKKKDLDRWLDSPAGASLKKRMMKT